MDLGVDLSLTWEAKKGRLLEPGSSRVPSQHKEILILYKRKEGEERGKETRTGREEGKAALNN